MHSSIGSDSATRPASSGIVALHKPPPEPVTIETEPRAYCDWLDPFTDGFLNLITLAPSPPASVPSIVEDETGAETQSKEVCVASATEGTAAKVSEAKEVPDNFADAVLKFFQQPLPMTGDDETSEDEEGSEHQNAQEGREESPDCGGSNEGIRVQQPKSAPAEFGTKARAIISPTSSSGSQNTKESAPTRSSWTARSAQTFKDSVKKALAASKKNLFRPTSELDLGARRKSWESMLSPGSTPRAKPQKEAPKMYHWQKAPATGSALHTMRQKMVKK